MVLLLPVQPLQKMYNGKWYVVNVSFCNIDFYCLHSTVFSLKGHRAILESAWFDMRKKKKAISSLESLITN